MLPRQLIKSSILVYKFMNWTMCEVYYHLLKTFASWFLHLYTM
jgi:hypothetical protein